MQWSDHDQNRRELARHSLRDAEAYDEFGRVLHQMARAVKPFLSMAAPDPASLRPRELLEVELDGDHFDAVRRTLRALARARGRHWTVKGRWAGGWTFASDDTQGKLLLIAGHPEIALQDSG